MDLLCNHALEIPKTSGEFSVRWSFSRGKAGFVGITVARSALGRSRSRQPRCTLTAWCCWLRAAAQRTRSLQLRNACCSTEPFSSLLEIFLGVSCIMESAVFRFLKDNNAVSELFDLSLVQPAHAWHAVHVHWAFAVSWLSQEWDSTGVTGGKTSGVLWRAFTKEKTLGSSQKQGSSFSEAFLWKMTRSPCTK